jgi:RNA polymerase sigma-70 factor (ECF subfamily)
MTISDSELIHRAHCGDHDAIVEIYERNLTSVFTYIFYRVSDQDTAEDLTAEVFLRMVTKIKNYTDRGRPILAWLYVIARNLIVDHYRNPGSTVHMCLREDLVAEDGVDPIQVIANHQEQDDLRKALEQLTEEQRQVILLKIIDGRQNAEVAAILEKSEGAVRSLQHRALVALHRVMQME